MGIGLVTLLRAGWVSVTLPLAIASIPISKLSSFRQLVSRFAKTEENMQSSSSVSFLKFSLYVQFSGLCFIFIISVFVFIGLQKFSVPQRFVSHFYIVAVVWTTLLLLTTWLYAYRMAPPTTDSFHFSHLASHLTGGSHIFSFHKSHFTRLDQRYSVWRTVLLLLLMEAQFSRRLFETFYVSNYSPSARMHVLGYLTGFSFYVVAPLSVCYTYVSEVFTYTLNLLSAFVVKGKNQMQDVEIDWWEFVYPLLKLGWRQRIGSAIFVWGWIHQHRCHAILVS